MSYPVYVPLRTSFGGGGGGGGGGKKEILVFMGSTLALLAGFSYAFDTAFKRPHHEMRLIKHNGQYFGPRWELQIQNNIPKEERRWWFNSGLDCLKKKGYSIHEYEREQYSLYGWKTIVTFRPPTGSTEAAETSIETILADCKECGAQTDVRYTYENIFGNKIHDKKIMDWYKSYKPQELDSKLK